MAPLVSEDVAYRPVCAGDAATLAVLIRTAFTHQEVAVDPPASALGVSEAIIAEAIRGGGGAVAMDGQLPVGTLLWAEAEGGLYLSRLAVLPAWRGRGIAGALLAAAERAALVAGLPRLHLGTRLALAGNRRLFAAHGFVEVARHAHPGYLEPTWVSMEKRLDGE